MEKKVYTVTGMHCASCSQLITKEVSKIDGVKNIDVNLATEQAIVEFDNTPVAISTLNKPIKELGYELHDFTGMSEKKDTTEDNHAHHHTAEISRTQLYVITTMVVIVFVMMFWEIGGKWGWRGMMSKPVMTFFHHLMPIFATYVFFGITTRYLKAAWQYLKRGAGNMDSLIGIGSSVAFLYSFIVTAFEGVLENYMDVSWNFYETIVVVIGFSLIGRYIEHTQLAKNENAIASLMKLQAKYAILIGSDGQETQVPIEQLKTGDIVVVKAGESIPVDGLIVKGVGEIDESMITGESMPVAKNLGDDVIGGTINVQGVMHIQATTVGEKSVLANIVQMVNHAQNYKPRVQKLADTIAGRFVPIVLILAGLTLVGWLIFGKTLVPDTYWLKGIIAFVAILCIACPCALGLATPLGIINGITRATKKGILVRNTDGLLALKDVKTIVFDKTGTVTSGKPQLMIEDTLGDERVQHLRILAILEKQSTHPLAHAVLSMARKYNLEIGEVENYVVQAGYGVTGSIDGVQYYVGNRAYAEQVLGEKIFSTQGENQMLQSVLDKNHTPIVLFTDKEILDVFGIADTIKKGMKETIQALHKMGITTVMCTGDHENVAKDIAKQLHIDEVLAEATPESKSMYIKQLREKTDGKVAMVGDGINDSVALSLADVSISMSDGSDVSIASSDLVILKGDLARLVDALHVSKSTNIIIKQNLFWAFSYNVVGIPLAGGWLYGLLGWQLNPVFSGIIMAASSLIVVLNSMRGMRK